MLRSPTLAALILPLCVVCLPAMESPIVGPRALAMGGTGVACADDYVAQHYNPASFGFFGYTQSGTEDGRVAADNQNLQRKDWGMGLDATAGAHLVGNLGTYLNDVLKIDVDKLQALGRTGSTDQVVLNDAVTALAALSSFDPDRDGVLVDANAGYGLRIAHFGIGVRAYGQAVGKLQDLDTTNIGITLDNATSVTAQINKINSGAPTTYVPQKLTTAQQTSIANALTLANRTQGLADPTTSELAAAIQKIDYAIVKSGIDESAIQGVVNQLDILTQSSVSNLRFGTNDTKLRLVGLSVVEIPVSYGYAFDDHFSIGGNLKYLLGRVYGLDVPLFNTDSDKKFSDYISDADQEYRQTSSLGIDLGLLARWSMLQVGLTGRNLNSPSFKAPSGFKDQRLEPQVTAGVAVIPGQYVTFAVDGDITRSRSILPGREYQRVGAGLELSAWRVVDLRAGLSRNIAESADQLLYSAGVGFNLYVMRIDLAAQATTDTITYDGQDYPTEARASLAVATDW